MSNRLVTLATFPSPPVAGFVKDLLAAEGVPAFLAGEMTNVMFWHLGVAVGWVKLEVAEADVGRAQEILENYRETLADLGREAFAAEATSCQAADDGWDSMTAAPEAGIMDDEVEDPNEDLASRALRSTVVGLAFVPLAVYGAWLVVRPISTKSELSARAVRKLWLAFCINLAHFLMYSLLLAPSPLPFAIGGVIVAAFCIRELVRWVNRRHSPRRMNPAAQI